VLPVVQLVIPIGFGREEFGILTWAGERLRFERLRFLGTAPLGMTITFCSSGDGKPETGNSIESSSHQR
jgi:hypothetical protein